MLAKALLFVILLKEAASLFEDQVGDSDWYHQFVGPVSFVSTDQSTQGTRGIVVASESGVLAAINARNGNITWRHVFEPERGAIDAVLHSKSALLTVSSSGQLLRSWDSASGALKWEVSTQLGRIHNGRIYPLYSLWRPNSVLATLAGSSSGSVIIVAGSQVASYVTRTGTNKWTNHLDTEGVPCAVFVQDAIASILFAQEHSKLIVAHINISDGHLLNKQELQSPWLSFTTTSCVVSGETITCLEGSKFDLYRSQLGTGERFSLTMLPSIGVTIDSNSPAILKPARKGNVWVQTDRTHWLVNLHGDAVAMTTHHDHTLPLEASLEGIAVDILVHYSGRELGIECSSDGGRGVEELSGSLQLKDYRGRPILASVHLFQKSDQSFAYRIAMVMEDHTLLMLQQPGYVVWKREEALATVVAMEMLDLPAGQSETTENFISLAQSEGNPLKLALQRVQLQVVLVKEFILSLQDKDLTTILQREDPTHLVRDQFNTRKLIITAAHNGKLYGLDSRNGAVMWQTFLPSQFRGGELTLHILRSTSHPPYPPLAVLVGQSELSTCTGSLLHPFDPLTGDPMTPEPQCLPQIVQMLLLPTVDNTHSKILLLLTQDHQVYVYPSAPDVATHLSSVMERLFLFVVGMATGHLSGHQVMTDSGALPLSTEQVWQLQFPTGSETIVSIATKATNELVSSPGVVKADRSVQYKYLNPHLFAVVTESTDSTKSFITVYLIDGVSGAVIHHTTHKQATGPVHIVISENWIVYCYYNSKLRRSELAVMEVYETSSNQSHTIWSSLTPPPPPTVIGQAYTFPTSLSAIATTHTLRGLTHKAILLGLHSGHIASLPKGHLDPRRAVEVTDEMREEGLMPYLPELSVKPVRYINYNRTVTRLNKIYTSSSGMESTCLVLACGLDLYFTRVTPSKQFDLLAEDFDYLLIAAVVLGLAVGTVVLSKLATRKTLGSLWK